VADMSEIINNISYSNHFGQNGDRPGELDMVMEPYTNSLEHLLAHLERIDLFIQQQVTRAREIFAKDAEFRGLFISDDEINAILVDPIGIPRWACDLNNHSSITRRAIEHLVADIEERKRVSIQNGAEFRLEMLAELFKLNDFEKDVLLLCLAPELDLRYERIYAYLHDDITKKRPSIDLILNLLCNAFNEKISARQYLVTESCLFKNQLLQLFEDPSQQAPPLLSNYVKINERIVSYLLGSDEIEKSISPYVRIANPDISLSDVMLPDMVNKRLKSFVLTPPAQNERALFYIQGTSGSGKKTTVKALCSELDRRLLIVDGARLSSVDEINFDLLLQFIKRESVLQNAVLYWEGMDSLQCESKMYQQNSLQIMLESHCGLVVLAGESDWEPTNALLKSRYVHIELPIPSFADRIQLWIKSMDGEIHERGDIDLEKLSNQFYFTGGQIQNAASTAKNMAHWRNPVSPHVTMDDLYTACRMQSNKKLATLATKITPRYTWDEIVLPQDNIQQLQEISSAMKYRYLVFDKWCFSKKLSLGRGFNILFVGPSGTGKTMAADVLAKELNIHLYKIDLSQVVSKYIGETEKNLGKIFQEATADNSILFFDEADALFGKRSEVKDAHDRFANIETGYLLQKMEEHDGIVILASNLRNNIDDAFVRRMYAVVEFPFPDCEHREKIWQRLFPDEVPWQEPLDFKYLARHLKLSGGHIKNVGLCAAFLSAEEGKGVAMRHLMMAIKREYQKLNRPCTEADFGRYYELIK
jgi:SpoVK/Ycf46/Vps4 family AAA+-type ATPase